MSKYGVIFDMDGVLADTLAVHGKAEKNVLASIGISIEIEEILRRFNGVHDNVWFQILLTENAISADINDLLKKKWELVYDTDNRKDIMQINGAEELLVALLDKGYTLSLASGSPRHFIDYILKILNLQKYFASTHSVEEVVKGKPSPDIFLLAAESIKRAPRNCLVIEDAKSGMTAAKSADMKCIGLVSDTAGDYPADLLVTSLTDVTPSVITGLFAIGH